MKAKEYAKIFDGNPIDETLVKIIMEFMDEIHSIIKTRNAKSESAIIAVLEELDKKYQAFARNVKSTEINPEGLRISIKAVMPKVYDAWQISKVDMNLSSEQIDNWRTILKTQLGPSVNYMTDKEITLHAKKLQYRVNEEYKLG